MMKDVDGISRYVDFFVYQYINTASRFHSVDVVTRPFAYSFDVFIRCNNQYNITAFDVLSISITNLLISSILILYHTPINVSTVFNFSSVLIIYHQDPECHV